MNDVERLARAHSAADFGVDLSAGKRDVEGGFAAGGQTADRGGVVALVRATDEKIAGTEGADDFGGAGEEGDYAHRLAGHSLVHHLTEDGEPDRHMETPGAFQLG